jgi:DtxR family Mn-dependent transcriptional regulator
MNYTVENYLKGLYALSAHYPKGVTTNALAGHMATKASSVTDMLKKLDEKGLVKHAPYYGTVLTLKGKKIALEIVRKHRLWEVFLVDKLHFGWDQVHEIAEQLEHVASPELVNRLDKYLNFPRFDPHGDPIPNKKGKFQQEQLLTLTEVPVGTKVLIRGVRDHSPGYLQHLQSLQMTPGQRISVVHRLEYDQSCVIQFHSNKEKIQISKLTADQLWCIAL